MDNQKYLLLKQRAYENKKKSIQKRNLYFQAQRQFIEEIRLSNRTANRKNHVCFNPTNTLRHEMMKARVCFELSRLNHEYYTEAIFNSGKRADIVDLETGVIYEILFTETKEELKEKTKDYPACFAIVPIDSKLPFNAGDIIDN